MSEKLKPTIITEIRIVVEIASARGRIRSTALLSLNNQ